MNKIISIVLVLILVLSMGCIDQPVAKEINRIHINESELIVPELDIMSVTIVQNVARIKVKNTGDVIVKDVYVGIVGISDTSYLSWSRPDYNLYLDTLTHTAILNGNHRIKSKTYVNPANKGSGFVYIDSKLIHKDYIGDINPDEIVTSEFGINYNNYDKYIKIVWTEDYSVYKIY